MKQEDCGPLPVVMSADPVTLAPDADADHAEKLMAHRQVRRMPVGETIKGTSDAKSGRGSHARG
jgi:CBS-domain-containing membrane protein